MLGSEPGPKPGLRHSQQGHPTSGQIREDLARRSARSWRILQHCFDRCRAVRIRDCWAPHKFLFARMLRSWLGGPASACFRDVEAESGVGGEPFGVHPIEHWDAYVDTVMELDVKACSTARSRRALRSSALRETIWWWIASCSPVDTVWLASRWSWSWRASGTNRLKKKLDRHHLHRIGMLINRVSGW